MRSKLCDEWHHHSALCVISICHMCSFKVQIWDPVVVGPRSNGPLVIGLCPFYPLFKSQLKCSSPLFSVNQESVSDREWALTRRWGCKDGWGTARCWKSSQAVAYIGSSATRFLDEFVGWFTETQTCFASLRKRAIIQGNRAIHALVAYHCTVHQRRNIFLCNPFYKSKITVLKH